MGPDQVEPPTFEPSEEDEAWVAGRPSPEDEDWLSNLDVEGAARYSAWADHLECLARITDEDVARVNCAG